MQRIITIHQQEPRGRQSHPSVPAVPPELRVLPALGELTEPMAYMARHSRSFRFAAALLPRAERDRIARVYAWCRFTDDLADGVVRHPAPTAAGAAPARQSGRGPAEARLDAWLACARAAYAGRPSGIPLVDRVMAEMAERGIPFDYAAELIAGVRSDLRFATYRDLGALRSYTYRVAGVVGRWLAELHDVHDPWMLERAAALGHAMQLTNILRDVGEDWEHGRLYIPYATLAGHGLTADDLGAMWRGDRSVDAGYRSLIEEMMAIAAHDYAAAREAMPYLPSGFRRATAVAAAVYEGIHAAIRENGYDNLRRRAATTGRRKVVLAAGALRSLARSRATPPPLQRPYAR